MTSRKRIAPISILTLLAAACSTESEPPPAAKASLPQGLLVAVEPAGAQPVDDGKKTHKAGDEVTLVGRIGGRREPFVAGRAVFALVSPKLETCDEIEGDNCKTPWDYCCEGKETMLANTATVRVVGANGEPLALDLNGQGGLVPGARVVVAGRVHENGTTFVVDARELFVAPGR